MAFLLQFHLKEQVEERSFHDDQQGLYCSLHNHFVTTIVNFANADGYPYDFDPLQ